MAKVKMYAVLSLDGCLSDNIGDACWALHPEKYGIDKLLASTEYELTPIYPTTRLQEDTSSSIFLIKVEVFFLFVDIILINTLTIKKAISINPYNNVDIANPLLFNFFI